MKNHFRKVRFSLLMGLLLMGCVVSPPKFFSKIESTTDLTYGYIATNPVAIYNVDLSHSIGLSYYYLSRLRTKKGNQLTLIRRYTVNNPNYYEPMIKSHNIYTGKPLNYGNGPLLDLYILVPENELDTIRLYVNPYLKSKVKIPNGLEFEKE